MIIWIPIPNDFLRLVLTLFGIATPGRLAESPLFYLQHWKIAMGADNWSPTQDLSCPRVFPNRLARRIAYGEKEYLTECQVIYHGRSGVVHGYRFLVRREDIKGMREALNGAWRANYSLRI